MKRIICIIIYYFLVSNFTQAKQLPEFVQQRLDSIKQKAEKSLIECRYWNYESNGYMTIPFNLGYFSSEYIFSSEETYLIDSLELNISVGIIYDDKMRDRIVQLIRNEYREDELDTLVNISINRNLIYFERESMKISKIDTLSIFRNAMDSLFSFLETKDSLDMFKKLNKIYDYEIFKSLQLDTTTIFKQTYDKVIMRERERETRAI